MSNAAARCADLRARRSNTTADVVALANLQNHDGTTGFQRPTRLCCPGATGALLGGRSGAARALLGRRFSL
eukprot:11173839-Lingulodinium_polyedra.AAC.1